jgi:PKD repeat protein
MPVTSDLSGQSTDDIVAESCIYTGTVFGNNIDHCRFSVLLDNGNLLQPVNDSLPGFFEDSLRVRINFVVADSMATVCMYGLPVFLTCAEILYDTIVQCQADFDYSEILFCRTPFNDTDTMVIPGYAYQFYDTSGDNVLERTWKFGNEIVKGDSVQMYIFNAPGKYEVCLSITTTEGCTSTICKDIVVGNTSECKALFEYFSPLDDKLTVVDFPEDLTFSFVNLSYGDDSLSWNWDFGDGTFSLEENPFHTFPGPGVYEVCLNIMSLTGCEDTYCQTLYLDSVPACHAYFEYCNYHILAGDSASADSSFIVGFKNLSSASVYYAQWDFGDGGVSNELNPVHRYKAPGVYNACLTIYGASGCMDTYCVQIYAGNEKCKTDFSHEIVEPDCIGYETAHAFYAQTSGQVSSYIWDLGDGNWAYDNEAIHIYHDEGYYDVCLTVEYASGCIASLCKSIYNSPAVNDSIRYDKCIASKLPGENDHDTDGISIYPVPASDMLNIGMYSKKNDIVTIQLITLMGQVTQVWENRPVSEGLNHFEIDLKDIETGTYIYRITSAEITANGRVSVLK